MDGEGRLVSLRGADSRLFRFGGDEEIELVERAGPIFAEEAREGAIGEEFAAGLAGSAVIGLVGSVANALDFSAATRAGKLVAAVNSHAVSESGDFFGEFAGGFGAEEICPAREAGADGFEESLDFGDGEFLREGDRREPGFPKDFVGVSVADAAEEARVGEGALERVVGGEKDGRELLESGVEDFETARIETVEAVFAGDDVKRGALLRAGFGPEEGAVREVEGGEAARGRDFGPSGSRGDGAPVKTPSNHKMKDKPEIGFEADADALAEAAKLKHFLAGGVGQGRVGGAEEKRTDDAAGFKSLAEDASREGFDVNGDVGEFRHVVSSCGAPAMAGNIVRRNAQSGANAALKEW